MIKPTSRFELSVQDTDVVFMAKPYCKGETLEFCPECDGMPTCLCGDATLCHEHTRSREFRKVTLVDLAREMIVHTWSQYTITELLDSVADFYALSELCAVHADPCREFILELTKQAISYEKRNIPIGYQAGDTQNTLCDCTGKNLKWTPTREDKLKRNVLCRIKAFLMLRMIHETSRLKIIPLVETTLLESQSYGAMDTNVSQILQRIKVYSKGSGRSMFKKAVSCNNVRPSQSSQHIDFTSRIPISWSTFGDHKLIPNTYGRGLNDPHCSNIKLVVRYRDSDGRWQIDKGRLVEIGYREVPLDPETAIDPIEYHIKKKQSTSPNRTLRKDFMLGDTQTAIEYVVVLTEDKIADRPSYKTTCKFAYTEHEVAAEDIVEEYCDNSFITPDPSQYTPGNFKEGDLAKYYGWVTSIAAANITAIVRIVGISHRHRGYFVEILLSDVLGDDPQTDPQTTFLVRPEKPGQSLSHCNLKSLQGIFEQGRIAACYFNNDKIPAKVTKIIKKDDHWYGFCDYKVDNTYRTIAREVVGAYFDSRGQIDKAPVASGDKIFISETALKCVKGKYQTKVTSWEKELLPNRYDCALAFIKDPTEENFLNIGLAIFKLI